jgi:CBS domain containing-hemolysin-like protein
MRPAVFVPETKLISELLAEFRRDKQKMAIVLDEYGGTAGLVTMGDILAEIVGEMGDEFDERVEDDVWRRDDGSADVVASLRISEVNEELELELPEEEDFETLAGFVLARLGHFPKPGEALVEDEVEFTVLEASDRRVLRVRVRRLAPQP